MTYAVTSPITGSPQTGLTSPTYSVASDSAPDVNGKQHAVTSLGGTQTGVTVHTVTSPFTITMQKPKQFKALGVPGNNGVISNVPNNTYQVLTRKGVTPAVNQPVRTLMVRTTIEVPAGSETYDAANVRAALSAHLGVLQQQSAGIGDTLVNGVF